MLEGLDVPDEDDVTRLHRLAIEKHGGEPGILKEGCVQSNLRSAVQASLYKGDEDDPELLHVVAYLLLKFARNHCFVDGNKRISWMVALDALRRNHLDVEASSDEAVNMVTTVVEDHTVDVDWVAEWFAERLTGLT